MKQGLRAILAICLCILATGCATAPPPLATADLFDDANVRPATEPVTARDLFVVSPAMQAYLDNPAFKRQLRNNGVIMGMMDALYTKGELKLDYAADTTRPAAETFAARKGNCLSLVIMTAAFAQALNLDVIFQDVVVDQQWSRSAGLYVSNTHVNLSLSNTGTNAAYDVNPTRTVIDFIPPADAERQRAYPIRRATIVAMYLNNRAGEALAQQRFDDAYWWARAAVQADPGFMTAYNTLGVAYQKRGNYLMAERVYKRALTRTPEDTIVMHNLVQVLKVNNKLEESGALAARLASIEPFPPYHFFEQGINALTAGQTNVAKAMFARELRRAPYNHEFHYWLALTHLKLGDARAARNGLTAAITHSPTPDDSRRYSAKLDYLKSLAASASPLPLR
ncbi:tetratricopeptide repeat protein [Massilia sp. PAMC28688]|uniref:tetratricopeptide repeat protein n=1 Tax=Massilia sp. PAMC28688 TaxID=2861283 RepID=UPI001C62BD28|nr:tetratricopeptide repeat protein [Massilia sp. PAMC28688]QYF95781.1 tetratricopeptide repeat protein [Massilia sp. PAMC28688]